MAILSLMGPPLNVLAFYAADPGKGLAGSLKRSNPAPHKLPTGKVGDAI